MSLLESRRALVEPRASLERMQVLPPSLTCAVAAVAPPWYCSVMAPVVGSTSNTTALPPTTTQHM